MTKQQMSATVNKAVEAAELKATVELDDDGHGLITIALGHATYIMFDAGEPDAGYEYGMIVQFCGTYLEPPETDYDSKGTARSLRDAADEAVKLVVAVRLADARVGELEEGLAAESDRVKDELRQDALVGELTL